MHERAEALGGEVESRPGEDTTVRVRFPLPRAHEEESRENGRRRGDGDPGSVP